MNTSRKYGCIDRNVESPLCLRASAGQPAVSTHVTWAPVQLETKHSTAVKKSLPFFLDVPSASREQTVIFFSLLLSCNIVCKDRETANLFIVFCEVKNTLSVNNMRIPQFLPSCLFRFLIFIVCLLNFSAVLVGQNGARPLRERWG